MPHTVREALHFGLVSISKVMKLTMPTNGPQISHTVLYACGENDSVLFFDDFSALC